MYGTDKNNLNNNHKSYKQDHSCTGNELNDQICCRLEDDNKKIETKRIVFVSLRDMIQLGA